MAALPYIQLYVSDYLADTAHLSTEEHGAYLLLIFNYWQTGKPLKKSRLASVARLSNERWPSVEQVLNEFFEETEEHWIHHRIEADLKNVSETVQKKIKAGKASGKARKAQSKQELKASSKRSTPAQQTLNKQNITKHNKTEQELYTSKDFKKSLLSLSTNENPVDEKLVDDWMSIRKKKKAVDNEHAFNLFKAEVNKSGLTVNQALMICCQEGWKGFKADWASNKSGSHHHFENNNYGESGNF